MTRSTFALVSGAVALMSLTVVARQGAAPAPAAPPPQGAAPAPQGPPAGRGPAPLQNPNPTYVSIVMTIDVNAPADKVWARIGKYCDIGEWGFPQLGCTMVSGKDGELGAVRSIGSEILVAKTDRSYTYTQPVRATGIYNMYHGTLEAKSLTPTTTQIVYSLFFDNSQLTDDAAREADITRRRNTFTPFLQNMKILAEGGTLPARGRGANRF